MIMNKEERNKKVEEISQKLLYEIIFMEKKNFNSKELKDSEMINKIKSVVEREVKNNEVQEDQA